MTVEPKPSTGYSNRPYAYALVGVALLIAVAWLNQDRVQPVTTGTVAPDFEVGDLDGGLARLSDHSGEVVLVNIWATWCPPCRREMPSMERLYQKFGKEDFEIMAVSIEAEFGLLDEVGQVELAQVGIDADRHDLEPLFTDLLIETLHRRHFNPAREAPRGPDVHQDDLTCVAAEASQTAVEVLDLEVRGDGSGGHRLNTIPHQPGDAYQQSDPDQRVGVGSVRISGARCRFNRHVSKSL